MPAKRISPSLFGLALLLFFLPFLTVSCDNEPMATVSGITLAIGGDVKVDTMMGSETEAVKPQAVVTIALLAVIAGVALSFVPGVKGNLSAGVAGLIATVCLFLVSARAEPTLREMSDGMPLTVKMNAGWTLTLLSVLAATVWNGYQFYQSNVIDRTSQGSPTHRAGG